MARIYLELGYKRLVGHEILISHKMILVSICLLGPFDEKRRCVAPRI
jgi:hypothetical protein